MRSKDISQIIIAHRNYWDQRKHAMEAYTRAYRSEMFREQKTAKGGVVTVETADAYGFVESFIASLFAKAPAVAVGGDPQGIGEPDTVEMVLNRFLYEKAEMLETGLRYALIYPCSFFKLGLMEKELAMDSIDIKAVHPWDVIIDMDANNWESMRFCGHRYYLPAKQAKERFGNKRFKASIKNDYLNEFNQVLDSADTSYLLSNGGKIDDMEDALLQYVEIYELYDLINDELIFYSPNYDSKDGVIEKAPAIPFRKADGTPCAPIAPMYLAYDPQYPLKGFSRLGLIYDQLWEVNNLRTVWANGLRRDARVYVTRKGTLDEEAKAILAENRDQSIVEMDLPPDSDARTAIVPLIANTFSPDYSIYKAEVRQDLDRGSILAPFTRGQATNASATEIAALTQYSASEIGKLARSRDRSLEIICQIYVSMFQHLLMTKPDDHAKEMVYIDGNVKVLTEEDFRGKFKYAAADQSSTPLSAAIKKQSITELLPVLVQLGVDPRKILEELIRLHNLPEDFMPEEAPPMPTAPGGGQGAQQAPLGPPADSPDAIPVGGGTEAAAIRGAGMDIIAQGITE